MHNASTLERCSSGPFLFNDKPVKKALAAAESFNAFVHWPLAVTVWSCTTELSHGIKATYAVTGNDHAVLGARLGVVAAHVNSN